MAIISYNNYRTEYLPAYYNSDSIRVQPLYKAYYSISVNRTNLRSNTYVCNFDIGNQDYYILITPDTNGSVANVMFDVYIEDNDNGDPYLGFIESIGYTPYINLYWNSTAEDQLTFDLVEDMQDPTLSNGWKFVLNSFSSSSTNNYAIEVGLHLNESLVHDYMADLIDANYDQGYNQGYMDSLNENVSPLNNGLSTISTLFDGVGGMLNYQIVPNVTIGGLVSIPLVIGLIFAIFKVMLK